MGDLSMSGRRRVKSHESRVASHGSRVTSHLQCRSVRLSHGMDRISIMALLNSDSVACLPSFEMWVSFGRSLALFGSLPERGCGCGCGCGCECGGDTTGDGPGGAGMLPVSAAVVLTSDSAIQRFSDCSGVSIAVTSVWHSRPPWRRHDGGGGGGGAAPYRRQSGRRSPHCCYRPIPRCQYH